MECLCLSRVLLSYLEQRLRILVAGLNDVELVVVANAEEVGIAVDQVIFVPIKEARSLVLDLISGRRLLRNGWLVRVRDPLPELGHFLGCRLVADKDHVERIVDRELIHDHVA